MTESRHLPGRLLQSSPDRQRGGPGTFKIIDLDLSKYDRIASRFHQEQEAGVSFLKGGIETRNRSFKHLIDRIERVAIATRDPLLLMGPTGAGKSRLARRIFELKKSRHAVKGTEERAEVKKVARQLLERLRSLLVIDWRKGSGTRARVENYDQGPAR